MKFLIIAGAGTSVELGVPGMIGMAEEFLSHARQWNVEPDLAEQLLGKSHDVEDLIEGLDQISSARGALKAIQQEPLSFERIDKLRSEVEWFVQHVAERVVAREAQLMWGPVLRSSASKDLVIVTTNYDRAIELAANAEKVELNDGFEGFQLEEIAGWQGFLDDDERAPLVKLHGSTDWYSGENGPVKLRHPMPLFGRSTLRLSNGQELGSALVLPSREKLLTHKPYPRLSQVFLNAVDHCDLGLVVGSSLRDPHLREAVESMAGRVPVFVVNPEGDTHAVEGVKGIAQYASTFLTSTLSNALLSGDPASDLAEAGSEVGGGSLAAVGQALDVELDAAVRCRAIEDLDKRLAPLDAKSLKGLLQDENATVARYALGLIPHSPVAGEMVDVASASEHSEDTAFAEELDLLKRLLDGTGQAQG